MSTNRVNPVPSEYLCPITHDIMRDPVVIECGHTFERESINSWLILNNTCPIDRRILRNRNFQPNWSLKSAIERYSSIRLFNI